MGPWHFRVELRALWQPALNPSVSTSFDNHHENLVMSTKNPVGDNDQATAVVADDWEETLKRVGGSQSGDWNHVLGNQALQSLWIENSDKEVRQRQYNAAIAGLIGIAPQDEIEGMIAGPSEQAVPHLRGSTRCTQSPPRQVR
jgi:hypothetical protein